jgi:pilus assembly protein Flp/PilA
MIDLIRALYRDQSGATALEYGLIAALVSVAAIGALTQLGGSLNGIFTTVSTQMDAANASAAGAGAGAGG